ncbi:MAG: thiamine pyrophosphate-binding protein [Pseudomonadota bacterium]
MSETRGAAMGETTAARLVAERLRAAGCRSVFGVPGGEVLAVMDALEAAGVAFTLVKHENAGGFMAEGAHHAAALEGDGDRIPGVLLATIGPGLANAVNTAANALQEQTPLIIISGSVGPSEAATYTHQVLDQSALMREAVKASLSLADGAVDVLIDRAVAIATSDPMGPVHVDLPVSLATKPQPPARRYRAAPAAPTAPAEGAALEAARRRIAGAERPVILAGLGAMQADIGAPLRAFAERWGAPVITTYKAKGVIDETHPLALGGHGLSPKSDRLLAPVLSEADCVLSVGYDPIEMRAGWIDPFPPERHVELTHAAALHGMHGAAVSFVGDLAAALGALAPAADRGTQGAPAPAPWPNGAPEAARAALADAFAEPAVWGPHQVFGAARRAAPAETIATADSGAHRILMSQMWRCRAPRTLLQSSAFCTMGVALPLAMGVKRAAPERPVLAVMGDAGLEMVLGELATLRDWGVGGFCVLVLADESLALIALKQDKAGYAPVGVDFGDTDWPAVAQALGGHGAWADDAAGLEGALRDGFARQDRFTLVAARISKTDYNDAF